MLQNAEDAGASEVRFVLDPSSYSREKIMAPIAGKNDLGRMQVNDWTSLGDLFGIFPNKFPIAPSLFQSFIVE